MNRRERNIAELMEWVQDAELDVKSPHASQRIFDEAKMRFLVTDRTASDYVVSILKLLKNPLRADLVIHRFHSSPQ